MQSPDKPCRGIQNVPVPYYRSATASLHNLEQVICQHCPFISSAEGINYPEADVRQYVKTGSRTGYNKESTMLLQEGDLLQDRIISDGLCNEEEVK